MNNYVTAVLTGTTHEQTLKLEARKLARALTKFCSRVKSEADRASVADIIASGNIFLG